MFCLSHWIPVKRNKNVYCTSVLLFTTSHGIFWAGKTKTLDEWRYAPVPLFFHGKHRYPHCNFDAGCLSVSPVLCNIHSYSTDASLSLATLANLRWDLAVQVNMIALLAHTSPGKKTRAPYSFTGTPLNYSELHNGTNQAYDCTLHGKWR
jgi:hypothetical protein